MFFYVRSTTLTFSHESISKFFFYIQKPFLHTNHNNAVVQIPIFPKLPNNINTATTTTTMMMMMMIVVKFFLVGIIWKSMLFLFTFWFALFKIIVKNWTRKNNANQRHYSRMYILNDDDIGKNYSRVFFWRVTWYNSV